MIREERYIVLKIKDLEKRSPWLINALKMAVEDLELPKREYVVVESDWPEYEAVWSMIEKRVNAC